MRTALDDIARADSSAGPHQVLPAAMELLAVIDTLARDATTPVRRELLGVGARAAEFTAWLHCDAGSPAHLTVFFHDRAAEWATLTGDGPMHAYVLLRKAQATDRSERDSDDTSASPTAPHGPGDTTPQVIRSTEGNLNDRVKPSA